MNGPHAAVAQLADAGLPAGRSMVLHYLQPKGGIAPTDYGGVSVFPVRSRGAAQRG